MKSAIPLDQYQEFHHLPSRQKHLALLQDHLVNFLRVPQKTYDKLNLGINYEPQTYAENYEYLKKFRERLTVLSNYQENSFPLLFNKETAKMKKPADIIKLFKIDINPSYLKLMLNLSPQLGFVREINRRILQLNKTDSSDYTSLENKLKDILLLDCIQRAAEIETRFSKGVNYGKATDAAMTIDTISETITTKPYEIIEMKAREFNSLTHRNAQPKTSRFFDSAYGEIDSILKGLKKMDYKELLARFRALAHQEGYPYLSLDKFSVKAKRLAQHGLDLKKRAELDRLAMAQLARLIEVATDARYSYNHELEKPVSSENFKENNFMLEYRRLDLDKRLKQAYMANKAKDFAKAMSETIKLARRDGISDKELIGFSFRMLALFKLTQTHERLLKQFAAA